MSPVFFVHDIVVTNFNADILEAYFLEAYFLEICSLEVCYIKTTLMI